MINAVRFRTPDGRYLTKAASGLLVASTGVPSQSATFRLVSRPDTSPFTIPPPAHMPMPAATQVSLAMCDSTWAPSNDLIRAEHSTLTIPPPPPTNDWDKFLKWIGQGPPALVTYVIGGPGTFVRVSGPFPSEYPAYVSDSNPSEWVFSIVIFGGRPFYSGAAVSLRIDSSRSDSGPFHFRVTSPSDQAPVAADATAPFTPGTVFTVEFHEVDSTITSNPITGVQTALGLRPPEDSIVCQTCGPVTGLVTDAAAGTPIAGATVSAQGVLDNHAFSATTSANGSFTLKDPEGRTCVPPGNITLRATADRHVPKTTNPIPDPSAGGANVPIALACTKVQGQVVDNNMPPNPQIFVSVVIEFPDGATMYATTNNSDGGFVFDCVRHGPASIRTPTLASQPIDVLPEGIFVNLVVQKDCVEVVGTVTDSATGQPICNATVLYFGSSASTKTDALGKYRLLCASPGGSHSVIVSKPGFKYSWVVINPFPASGSVTKDVALEPTSIPGLFNTGVDGCRSPLADGTIGDPHYELISVPSGTTAIRVRTSAGGYPVPPYIGDDSDSAWIGPNGDDMLDGPAGQYVYRTTFDLTGLVLSSVSISGNWSTDNDGAQILLNGVDTGIPSTDFGQFELGFAPFVINSGFVAGLNTLDFVVNNGGGPTALRVEMSSTASI